MHEHHWRYGIGTLFDVIDLCNRIGDAKPFKRATMRATVEVFARERNIEVKRLTKLMKHIIQPDGKVPDIYALMEREGWFFTITKMSRFLFWQIAGEAREENEARSKQQPTA